MKKMYIIVCDEVYDYENFPHKPLVYFSEKEVKAALEELKSLIKKEYPSWMFDDGETSISCYLDGEYSCNHYDATIYEYDLNVEITVAI